MSVTLIVPAYNEAKRIGRMLADYLGFFDKSVKLFIVLNGCRDNTLEIVQEWKTKYPDRLDYINYERDGKGWAVRQGWKQVDDDWVGVVDADDVTCAQEFNKLIVACQKSDDCAGAIASRYIAGAKVQDRVSILRRIASHIYRFIVKVLFWLPYHDTQCGAKLFRGEVIKKIIPYLHDDSMAFDLEVLLVCRRLKYKIIEIPTIWIETEASAYMPTPMHVIKTSIKMLKSILKLRFKNF